MCLLLLLATLCSGCTSTYWNDRGRDALDIVSFGYGVGWGTKVHALGTFGLLVDQQYAGLRGGEFMQREFPYSALLRGDVEDSVLAKGDAETVFLCIGRARFNSTQLNRGKNYDYLHIWDKLKGSPMNAAEYTHIEVCVGLGTSIRVGFNPGELLDFLLGWFFIDIYSDDVGRVDESPLYRCIGAATSDTRF